MSVLVCHPGRYGDLLWALPTVRALAEKAKSPAHLILPTDPADTTPMHVIYPLLVQQWYLSTVEIDRDWSIIQDAPRLPLYPPGRTPAMVALGHRAWPRMGLPYQVAADCEMFDVAAGDPDHFFRPWITTDAPEPVAGPRLLVHWTDRYFELKLGILKEIERLMPGVKISWYAQTGSRMCQAGAVAASFKGLARAMAAHTVVLTDCSAAHVLAAGIGVPHVLVVEPEEARHHFVFWPGCLVVKDECTTHWRQLGTPLGRAIRPVMGSDGRPTFDSRHTIHEITQALEAH